MAYCVSFSNQCNFATQLLRTLYRMDFFEEVLFFKGLKEKSYYEKIYAPYQHTERVMPLLRALKVYGSSHLGINTNKVDMLDENPCEVVSLTLGFIVSQD